MTQHHHHQPQQVHRQFRKPLIVMAPKNLLRHPKCRSSLDEFDDVPGDHGIVGVRFKRLIMDDSGLLPKSRAPRPPQEPEFKRVVFCTGKVRASFWWMVGGEGVFFFLPAAQNPKQPSQPGSSKKQASTPRREAQAQTNHNICKQSKFKTFTSVPNSNQFKTKLKFKPNLGLLRAARRARAPRRRGRRHRAGAHRAARAVPL